MLQRLLGMFKRDAPQEDHPWFYPPDDRLDPAAWDKCWRAHFAHDAVREVDMFCWDGALIDAMHTNGLRTVLCVGNGISQEPKALAAVGFDVTALDLSPFAVDMAVKGAPSPRYLERIVEGRPMRPGRRVDFVVGDLYDGTVCPGPYDVVIECRTLQLFVRDGGQALQVVANRLSARAIFFSHAHDGGWRPPAPRKHLYEDWFSAQQWPRWSEDRPITQRVAWLSLSTG